MLVIIKRNIQNEFDVDEALFDAPDLVYYPITVDALNQAYKNHQNMHFDKKIIMTEFKL